MRTLRTALTVAALCLLSAGYAASQIAFFTGRFAQYAASVDTPPVRTLSGLFLVAAIALAFIPDHSSEGSS